MTENELLLELEQLLGIPEIEPDEITVSMLAEKLKISPKNVRERLKAMVEAGQLTSRLVRLPDGYRCIAYRKKSKS